MGAKTSKGSRRKPSGPRRRKGAGGGLEGSGAARITVFVPLREGSSRRVQYLRPYPRQQSIARLGRTGFHWSEEWVYITKQGKEGGAPEYDCPFCKARLVGLMTAFKDLDDFRLRIIEDHLVPKHGCTLPNLNGEPVKIEQ